MLELPRRGPITLLYPVDTYVRFEDSRQFQPRTIRVLGIRDLVREPLTVDDFLRRPFIRRSRYLLQGYEHRSYRQFYLGCTEEYQAPSQLRIALYQPGKNRPLDLVSRPFNPSVLDRKHLVKTLLACRERDFGELVLRVFADDFGVVD